MRRGFASMPAALRKGLWFVGLWLAGVLVVGVVAYGIRLMIL
ncbi:DUF2474 domain-containing protein [Parvularcula dongshanensis]|uniref:DUF2474 domain-containing protein n=1 Tax=Parvularcula dongshanensis TaxID=1173995 RepID=A0A840I4Q8_9PROT|nr:DUF2474 domain-containing protein [Parvularcula dongshanensis]MBB4659261.1 hypothetical protein [Parvularcula dongshanensis]